MDYSNYTLEELYDVKRTIDKETFPERYQSILEHISIKQRHSKALATTQADDYSQGDSFREQSLWQALFSRDIESANNADKILKLALLMAALPFLEMIVLHVFFQPTFEKFYTNNDIIIGLAYIINFMVLVMGYDIYRRRLWTAYALLIIYGIVILLSKLNDASLPRFIDLFTLIIFAAAIRSIKFLKDNQEQLSELN
ncbi:MAG: hypothetical protein V2I33_05555 [Kangiellaceae bacterium]|jgi:hypothetical protein|nr:hypothetical protein [Kangiellaceae bacterium]